MGSTDYYSGTILARDLATIAIPVKELDQWKQWNMEERIQRDIAMQRIRSEIVPYLVNSPDRFFGSLIILVFEPDVFEFESVNDLGVGSAPAAYSDHLGKLGVLTVQGGALVALDGQHRLVALREVISGGDSISGKYVGDVASDEVCVVFVRHENLEKTRRIFNKVNQHARPTSSSDNLITSEDDGRAIVARWLLSSDPPLGITEPKPPLGLLNPKSGEPIVEWRSATLKQGDEMLTTLVVVADSVEIILGFHGLTGFDEKRQATRPADEDLLVAYRWSCEWWSTVLERFEPFQRSVAKPFIIPELRESTSRWSLAMRPVVQKAIFYGLEQARRLKLPLDEAVDRLNSIDWRPTEDHWRDIIVTPGNRMITKKPAIALAGQVIGYLIAGDRMTDGEVNRLRMAFAEAKGWDNSKAMPALPTLPEM
jgi:DNA sulfur modification protein DndB